MRFEKLNENKIKITLTIQDLIEKEIDLHTFMSNSLERQDLFLDMLEEADEEIGFDIRDCNIRVETIATPDGQFILTITKAITNNEKEKYTHKKIVTKRKHVQNNFKQVIYKFDTFEDFCTFIKYLSDNKLENTYKIAKNITLYLYKQDYYLILSDINTEYPHIAKFNLAIIEFSKYINNSEIFIGKLLECGIVTVKNNAIKTGIKYFINY